jgi:hypothetical protein
VFETTPKTELAGVLQDEFAVACVVTIELKAGLVRNQWLEQGFAINKRQARDVPSADARGHSIAIELDLVHLLWARRRLSTGWESCGGMNCGETPRRDLTACETERLMTREMTRTLNSNRKGGHHDTRRHARPSSNLHD